MGNFFENVTRDNFEKSPSLNPWFEEDESYKMDILDLNDIEQVTDIAAGTYSGHQKTSLLSISRPQEVESTNLPLEIIYQIIETLNASNLEDYLTLLCFALTAHTYYRFIAKNCLKYHFVHPDPDLKPQNAKKARRGEQPWACLGLKAKMKLMPRLKNWMGDNYRCASPRTIEMMHLTDPRCNVMFLSRKMYGTDKEESVLLQRHVDYHNLTVTNQFVPMPRPYHNKTDWYEHMAYAVIDSVIHLWDNVGYPYGDPPSISQWFDENDLRGRMQIFWETYLHSSLRAWVHHEEGKFMGLENTNDGFEGDERQDGAKHIRRWQLQKWTYTGQDNFHRGVWLQEGVTAKEILKAIERDVEEAWGPIPDRVPVRGDVPHDYEDYSYALR